MYSRDVLNSGKHTDLEHTQMFACKGSLGTKVLQIKATKFGALKN